MTPAEFADYTRQTAQAVEDGTGIESTVLQAQWANETDWGNVVVGNNLGNIRDAPGSFARYPTLEAFAQACVQTFRNGYYDAVLAAQTPAAQLAAIVASPWSSGHYGGSLQSFYDSLQQYEMSPDEHLWTFTSADVAKNQLLPAVNALATAVKALGDQLTAVQQRVDMLPVAGGNTSGANPVGEDPPAPS